MDEWRAIELLSDIVDYVLIDNSPDVEKAVGILERYGFEPEELVEEFGIPKEYVKNYNEDDE